MDRAIETERLSLRVPVATDLAAVATLWRDPELVKFIGRRPLSREQAWQRLLRLVGHWALAGYGVFVMIERATGRYVGEVGIANFERDVVPPIGPFEMGWIVSPSVQGRGYASEAVSAVLALHDRHFPRAVVSCSIHADHAASLRVAAKHGFVERARTTYNDDPNVILDRKAST
ncbi:MAG TPA: GNAT family N-acetyltransferase [Polyangiaceae bacterium]|jgi:RimJ/RimL family protein N-acetyltransferase